MRRWDPLLVGAAIVYVTAMTVLVWMFIREFCGR